MCRLVWKKLYTVEASFSRCIGAYNDNVYPRIPTSLTGYLFSRGHIQWQYYCSTVLRKPQGIYLICTTIMISFRVFKNQTWPHILEIFRSMNLIWKSQEPALVDLINQIPRCKGQIRSTKTETDVWQSTTQPRHRERVWGLIPLLTVHPQKIKWLYPFVNDKWNPQQQKITCGEAQHSLHTENKFGC